MAGDRPRPIFSSLCEDPSLQNDIDAFVIGLAERIDELQDCEVRGDLSRMAELAEDLLLRSAKIGYDSVSRSAANVRASAREGRSEQVRKTLVELTEMAHRVRLGHRGSV